MSEWTVRIRADLLKPGDRFIFADEIGGEGETLTVEWAGNSFGTLSIGTEELDFELDVSASQMVTIVETDEDNTTMNPVVPDPADASSYNAMKEGDNG